MAIITTEIPEQSFEAVAVRIGAILKDELANQFILSNPPDPVLDATVFLERFIPVGDEENFVVNVMYASSDFQNEDALQSDGLNQYFIDVHTTGTHTDAEPGDAVSLANLKRLLGKIRAILRDSKYFRLLFNSPIFINRSIVKSINISEPRDNKDGAFVMQGRLVLEVNAVESEGVSLPTPLDNLLTKVTIEETALGYQYLIDQP